MVLTQICAPALIYLVFSVTQISIDTIQGMYNTALIKLWVAFIFTILLNYLCIQGLGIVSWLIVFIPFILMTVIVGMLLLMLGLDPTTGKLKKYTGNRKHRRHRKNKQNGWDNTVDKWENKTEKWAHNEEKWGKREERRAEKRWDEEVGEYEPSAEGEKTHKHRKHGAAHRKHGAAHRNTENNLR